MSSHNNFVCGKKNKCVGVRQSFLWVRVYECTSVKHTLGGAQKMVESVIGEAELIGVS